MSFVIPYAKPRLQPLKFADPGNHLAGQFFQASLPPYVGFLYLLSKTDAPKLVQFSFSYLLLFVAATIPTGIMAKSMGVSLADCDWLHGSAESLLTVTNILLILGFRGEVPGARRASQALAVAVAAYIAMGGGPHDPFLIGSQIGDPVNALSIDRKSVV